MIQGSEQTLSQLLQDVQNATPKEDGMDVEYPPQKEIKSKTGSLVFYEISASFYCNNRRRILDKIHLVKPKSLILLRGVRANYIRNTYIIKSTKQESNFRWLFGVSEPGFWGAIDVSTGNSYLFCPPPRFEVGESEKLSKEYLKEKFGITFICPIKEMETELASLGREELVILPDKVVPNEKVDFPTISCHRIDEETLWPILSRCRKTKSKEEVDLIEFAVRLTCEGHRFVMKFGRPGFMGYAIESLFRYYSHYVGNCTEIVKQPKCTTVRSLLNREHDCPALPNNVRIVQGDMCYCEMGSSYCGYGVNMLSTFPISGKFTKSQKIVYKIVAGFRKKVLEFLQPNIIIRDFLKIAEVTLIEELLEADLLKGNVEELISQNVINLFTIKPFINVIEMECMNFGNWNSYDESINILEPEMIILLTSQCFISKERLLDEEVVKYLTSDTMELMDSGSAIQDVVLVTSDGFRILSKTPTSIRAMERLRESVDFQDRKGKAGVDILKGKELFPDPEQLVAEKLAESRRKFREESMKK